MAGDWWLEEGQDSGSQWTVISEQGGGIQFAGADLAGEHRRAMEPRAYRDEMFGAVNGNFAMG